MMAEIRTGLQHVGDEAKMMAKLRGFIKTINTIKACPAGHPRPHVYTNPLLTTNRTMHIIQLKNRTSRVIRLARAEGATKSDKGGDSMVSFEQFQMEDGSPIYLQIVSFVQRGIVAGTITDGDEMPSRRVLSALIGVNPNTIQKAYRQLEDDGIIESRSGAKSYVTITDTSIKKIRTGLLSKDTQNLIKSMKQMGISMEEAISLVAEAWSEEE